MRLNIRWDDQPKQGSYSQDHTCSVDIYVNTREELAKAQYVINALLDILPSPQPDPAPSTEPANG